MPEAWWFLCCWYACDDLFTFAKVRFWGSFVSAVGPFGVDVFGVLRSGYFPVW